MASAAAEATLAPLEGNDQVTGTIARINAAYSSLHEAYEENFWATKMGLKVREIERGSSTREREKATRRKRCRNRFFLLLPSLTPLSSLLDLHLHHLHHQGNSPDQLSATKTALESFLADSANLSEVEKAAKAEGLSAEQRRTLECLRTTFAVSQLPAEASRIRAELNELEAALASDRREMRLGYENGKGEFVEASTVQLRQVLRSSADEREREAAWKGLRSIGPHVAEKFAEIVKKRNAMARAVSSENEVR